MRTVDDEGVYMIRESSKAGKEVSGPQLLIFE